MRYVTIRKDSGEKKRMYERGRSDRIETNIEMNVINVTTASLERERSEKKRL